MKKLTSILLAILMVCSFSVSALAQAPKVSPIVTQGAVRASGFVYGPWFGGGHETWTTSVQSWASFAVAVGSAVSLFVPNAIAKNIGSKVATAAGIIKATGFEVNHTYGTVDKTYREVKYSDGEFAYWESKYVIKTTVVSADGKEENVSSVTEYYQGLSPMSLDEISYS